MPTTSCLTSRHRDDFRYSFRATDLGYARVLADPIKVDSSDPNDPMAQLAVVLRARFGQMERTYAIERAAHARAVATAEGRRIGRPVVVDPAKLDYAAHLRHTGHTIAEIVAKTGIPHTSLYRHLPPRAAPTVTADSMAETDAKAMRASADAD